MAFQAGQILTAPALNLAIPVGETQSVLNTTFGSTNSATYTPTLTGPGTVTLAFVAPGSGAISVTFTAAISPQTTTAFGAISVAISGAAGTFAASDDYNAYVISTDPANDFGGTVERTKIFTGLTPGAAGTITMNHKSSSGTTDFGNRQIIWRPVGG
jgi:hypothetical protein